MAPCPKCVFFYIKILIHFISIQYEFFYINYPSFFFYIEVIYQPIIFFFHFTYLSSIYDKFQYDRVNGAWESFLASSFLVCFFFRRQTKYLQKIHSTKTIQYLNVKWLDLSSPPMSSIIIARWDNHEVESYRMQSL